MASSIRSDAEDELFSTKSLRGGKNWAILIGVNYTARQDELRDGGDQRSREALPALSNAANDALSIADILTNYYEYDADHVIVLTDDKGTAAEQLPTKSNIARELLRVSKEAGDKDTVFFFFAGHGIKLESQSTSGNNVAMLALDVELQEGDPIGNMFGLPFGLMDDLGRIKANQKLLVLDCCHSGEIFNQHRASAAFQPTSEESGREDKNLLAAPAFQAMASCRASQLASDGRDGNSKFTSAFLHGLRRLPAQNQKSPVTAHALLRHLKGYFDESQRPDLRSLIDPSGNEGEFAFKPRREAEFKKFLVEELEEAYLRGMVVSRQGSWWFEECPWFIPSIRAEMVQIYDSQEAVSRGSTVADLLDAESLREAADLALREWKDGESDVAKLRRKHGQLLLDADSGKKLREALAEIEADLDPLLPTEKLAEISRGKVESVSPTNSMDKALKAADVHLLAVVKHSLGNDEAEKIYKQALRMYALEMQPTKSDSPTQTANNEQVVFNYSRKILMALCRVDFAQYLQGEAKQHKLAAEQYQLARREIKQITFDGKQKGYADFFMTFAFCGEADAWIGINRWKQANALLDQAKTLAETKHDGVLSPVAGHFLEAHVYRRNAWCKMMQWKIKDAMCSFRKSNEILVQRMNVEDSESEHDDACTSVLSDELPAGWEQSKDYSSKVAFLHNRHGIAMGLRFQGDTEGAADEYRQLTRDVESAFSQFRSDSADAAIETQFVIRTINTQERLGDCNLFGNPEVRDLKEALDDYRRAMMRVHLLRDSARDRTKAALLYKQALALSLPSPFTDHELAMQMCQVADEIYRSSEGKTGGLFDALGTLTTLCVQACEETTESKTVLARSTSAQDKLRDCILAYRDKVGTTPHRDQLELCLFASNILLKYAGQRNKYQTLADADLLLSFCRIALESYQGSDGTDSPERQEVSDAVKYLRPYFDTAMHAKMGLGDSQVKEMLQIQAEATLGTLDLKEKGVRPILAIYVLDDKPYLLVDIPRSLSRCVPLAESYYNVEMVRNASYSEAKLPLPDEIQDALSSWIKQNSTAYGTAKPDCRWCDTVRGFDAHYAATTTVIDSTTGEEKTVVETTSRSGTFPFELHRP
ncbi:secreted protein containing Peptidase C14, caspase catalytic domain protein [Rhodopirellula maiorica SM1]|uniref:Secreted protein containing Peptidase C14, caspase catalytic domain protein n=1 Tax=Rhodopirellula maiorica SM1 TaxID=1265738 RepID=M5RE70_9BACT|nr:caspase family protein [Rhodopirellula maiorica]EMI17366.1 secreted protein containing Peptidase C14, caspase catalytic domain protein [Rhodopirellula maiorica SM1]